MARVLIAGCGAVGTALGERLVADSHTVWGLRRCTASLPATLRAIEADLSIPSTLDSLPRDLDFVFYTASPGGSDDLLYRAAYVDGLRHLLEVLRKRGERPSRIFLTTSTGVYAHSRGEWVDERSPTEPTHFSGKRMLEGERMLQRGPFPATVVRLAGIYGPRRTRLLERVRSARAVYRHDPPQYTNRIHLDDCAGVLHHLMRLPNPEAHYVGVDCEPAAEREVLNWLAGALGATPPRPTERGEGEGRHSNKRCRNERLLESGYVFRYPTFREGYRALIEQLR